MLQEMPHIEGYEGGFEQVDLENDTPLGVTLVSFYLECQEMPALSDKEGRIVRQNVVRIKKIINLGNAVLDRPIKDKVEFRDGKWVVVKLAKGEESDIKQYTREWNIFARGSVEDVSGTPLQFLFKNDPAKVAAYKSLHIHTVEQLERCTDAHIEQIGLGGRDDRELARKMLTKVRDEAPALALNNRLEQMEAQIYAKDAQIADLTAKLTELLRASIEQANKPEKKAKTKAAKHKEETQPEGIEGLVEE